MKKISSILILISLIFACSKKEEKPTVETSYLKALKLLEQKSYAESADHFEKIDEDFPFSKWALKAQVMAVYARYKEEDYIKLLQLVDDFLQLNPASEYAPYMLYMKGLSYYNQIPGIERAQDNTQKASFIFRELIARFPDSDYADDAKGKLGFIDEHLAGAKMSVGRYQIKMRNYVGAINNFHEVIWRYRQTEQVPEAYFRLMEIYHKIGLKAESHKAFNKLKAIFPESFWAQLAIKKYKPSFQP